METLILVEELDRRGRVRVRHRLATLPATLGRAPDNDVILDHPEVSAHHARLEEDEAGAVLVDLDSRNGLALRRGGPRLPRLALAPGLVVQLGPVSLRLRRPGDPVEATAVSTIAAPLAAERPWALGLALAAALSAPILAELASSWRPIRTERFGGALLMLYLLLGLWAGLWSLVNRVANHRFAFGAHLAVALGGFAALIVALDPLPGTLGFAFSSEWLEEAWVWLACVALVAATLRGHLRLVRPVWRRGGLAAVTVAFAVAVTSLGILLSRADRPSFSAVPVQKARLRPPWLQVRGARSLDEFFAETARLEAEVEALAGR